MLTLSYVNTVGVHADVMRSIQHSFAPPSQDFREFLQLDEEEEDIKQKITSQDFREFLQLDEEEEDIKQKIIKMERRMLRVFGFETFEFTCAGAAHPHSLVIALLDEDRHTSPKRNPSSPKRRRSSAKRSPGSSPGSSPRGDLPPPSPRTSTSLAQKLKRKQMLHRALAYCNDSLHTSLCCREESEVIASACLSLAAREFRIRENFWRRFLGERGASVSARHAASVEREI